MGRRTDPELSRDQGPGEGSTASSVPTVFSVPTDNDGHLIGQPQRKGSRRIGGWRDALCGWAVAPKPLPFFRSPWVFGKGPRFLAGSLLLCDHPLGTKGRSGWNGPDFVRPPGSQAHACLDTGHTWGPSLRLSGQPLPPRPHPLAGAVGHPTACPPGSPSEALRAA